ncbi:alpha/beta fold hydrolase [Candidatus Gracilibacteria bacterium]|nr:alpha/beta fold hydrolase [Candidatus Gracilibacteria bacterium]
MARTPVVFVPGLGGSFNLSVLMDWRGPTLAGWNFPPFLGYGATLGEAFSKAGYARDRDYFVAFYDWRKSVRDSAANYLVKWIDRAKQRSGSRRVILVGHSMGGLVSRSYIQSKEYRGDVERLITLGTPHRGSAESYYPWGGGELRSEPTTKAVLNVYLWYLRHAHPFQTELDPLRTMRTLVTGVRDLLPIDDYLKAEHGRSTLARPEDRYVERNLWGDLLNTDGGLAALLSRVPVTTIAGTGFPTISAITVGSPFSPPGTPPRYPDGVPGQDHLSNDGDQTVLVTSAQINHPQVRNLPPQPVAHGQLPDNLTTLGQLMGELGTTLPSISPPAVTPQLVILSASPVTLEVETPSGPVMRPDGVLGGASTQSKRGRRIQARDYGHAGKHLNMVVIPQPAEGTYNVKVHGTGSGTFALGAMLISAEGSLVLGGTGAVDGGVQPTTTAIETRHGQVAAESELFYQVTCTSLSETPRVEIDRAATTRNAVVRLRGALNDAGSVLGSAGGSGDERLRGALNQRGTSPAMRAALEAVLQDDDSNSSFSVLGASSASEVSAAALADVAETMLAESDDTMAAALITQLGQLGGCPISRHHAAYGLPCAALARSYWWRSACLLYLHLSSGCSAAARSAGYMCGSASSSASRSSAVAGLSSAGRWGASNADPPANCGMLLHRGTQTTPGHSMLRLYVRMGPNFTLFIILTHFHRMHTQRRLLRILLFFMPILLLVLALPWAGAAVTEETHLPLLGQAPLDIRAASSPVSRAIAGDEQQASLTFWTRDRRAAARALDLLPATESDLRYARLAFEADAAKAPTRFPGALPVTALTAVAQQRFASDWVATELAPEATTENREPETNDRAAPQGYEYPPPFTRYSVNSAAESWTQYPFSAIGRLFLRSPRQKAASRAAARF